MPVRLGPAYPRGSRSRVFVSYVVGLRFKRYGIREMFEVCILTVGHSRSRARASYQRSSQVAIPAHRLPARLPFARVLWLLLAQFLETRIIPEWIEHWIE